ncbi:class I SAM-dependent methyltransferase [Piscinibacter sakaiensis]|uniref:class I SAM-dependent methyltransferase n=1 Tax=Piscinibacter sakaiensis TaxID=1547922 RepID=UPI003AAC8265
MVERRPGDADSARAGPVLATARCVRSDCHPGSKKALGVGCFPGKFIEYVAGKGYVVSGFDTYQRVGEIASSVSTREHAVGSFRQTMFEHYVDEAQERFDTVLSLGFIEHFNDFCDVLYGHLHLCTVGGRIVVGRRTSRRRSSVRCIRCSTAQTWLHMSSKPCTRRSGSTLRRAGCRTVPTGSGPGQGVRRLRVGTVRMTRRHTGSRSRRRAIACGPPF